MDTNGREDKKSKSNHRFTQMYADRFSTEVSLVLPRLISVNLRSSVVWLYFVFISRQFVSIRGLLMVMDGFRGCYLTAPPIPATK
jgi:hypothetical protein